MSNDQYNILGEEKIFLFYRKRDTNHTINIIVLY